MSLKLKHRKLSLMGKVTVIKTFAILTIIYPFTAFKTEIYAL